MLSVHARPKCVINGLVFGPPVGTKTKILTKNAPLVGFDYQLLIFNRCGETIFESNDSNVGWDGTYGDGNQARYVQDGTYAWCIEFKLKRNDSRKIVSGHVNVIR